MRIAHTGGQPKRLTTHCGTHFRAGIWCQPVEDAVQKALEVASGGRQDLFYGHVLLHMRSVPAVCT